MKKCEESKKEQVEGKKKSTKKYWKVFIILAVIVCVLIAVILAWYAYVLMNLGNAVVYKPVIYLYPEETSNIMVKLGNPELLTCSYPTYNNGWTVIANPDGTLIDINTQRELYSLYWEAKGKIPADMSEGFVVKGENVVSFLEEKLDILGLTNKEAEEFIIYWLPKLQNNKYNYIRFANIDEINEYMPLTFSVEPDTLIRVLMQYKALDEKIEVEEQKLETPERTGFVVVEWGGTEIL